jgi:hypothetical protein
MGYRQDYEYEDLLTKFFADATSDAHHDIRDDDDDSWQGVASAGANVAPSPVKPAGKTFKTITLS